MFTRRGVSLKLLVLLTYLLLLALTFTLLVNEFLGEVPVFSILHTNMERPSGKTTLEIYGEHFHSGVKGVLARNLVKEEATLWHHYKELPFRFFDKRKNLVLASYRSNKLVSISLADEAAPKLLGSIETEGLITRIKIIGNKAVVGTSRSSGVFLVDVSNPEHLTLSAHYPAEGSVHSIVEGQGFVYFAGVGLGVARLDLAEKKPELVTLANLDSPWRMAIQGKRLAVATLKGRVHLFEIGGEGQLVEVGTLDFPAVVWDIAFSDEKLVVAVSDKSLSSFNLANWPALKPAGLLSLPGRPMAMERVPGQETVVVSLISNGLCMVDVGQAQKPLFRWWLKQPQTYQNLSVNPERVIATGKHGLRAFSLAGVGSEVMPMRQMGVVVTQESYRLKSWGQYVYGFDKQGVGKILGETPEKAPPLVPSLPLIDKNLVGFFEQQVNGQLQKVGSLSLRENALEVQYRRGHLYVLHHDGLSVFSGESPETMVAASDLSLPGNPQSFVFLSSGVMMVSLKDQGLMVVDVEDPEEPKLLSSLRLPRHLQGSVYRDMLVDGSRLYVSQGVGGVQIFDISAPRHPVLIQVVETSGHAGEMVLYDGLLLVAVWNSEVFIVDVADPEQALPIGFLPVPLRIQQIAVAENGLIVSGQTGGTMKLPLPQRLRGLRMVNEGELAVDVAAVEKGHYVYLYDQMSSSRIAVDVP